MATLSKDEVPKWIEYREPYVFDKRPDLLSVLAVGSWWAQAVREEA